MRGRFGNLAVLLVAVALCYAMMVSKPHYADLIAPIPVHAAMKDTVIARTFGIHVDKVTFARSLQAEHFGEPKLLTTGGVWAIVEVSLSASNISTTVGEAVWRGPTGLSYRMTERVGFSPGLPPHTVEPGLPKRGLFVFEIPPDQIAGATLLVLGRRFTPLDSEAAIAIDDVPLDEAGQPRDVVGIYDVSEPI
jgi:hypothetical protein